MGKKIISFLSDGILSGIFLCVGCCVSMSVESKPLGAFLFSLGLCAIIVFKFGLFTGKAGYMAVKPLSYVLEVVLTFIGNATGAAIGGFLLNLTRLGATLSEKAAAITATKFADSPLSIFVLAVFCGILMFTAVDGNKRAAEKGDFVMSLFIVVLTVMVFILCGFNHCIADTCYFFISKCANASQAAVYFLCAVLGNAVGCMSVPMVKKLSLNKCFNKKSCGEKYHHNFFIFIYSNFDFLFVVLPYSHKYRFYSLTQSVSLVRLQRRLSKQLSYPHRLPYAYGVL